MAHDRNDLALEFQLLVYPAVDRDFDTESYRSNSDGYSLTKDAMVWFWNHYLRDEADASNPYASPMKYSDLSGLPPALVITAEFDPLCSEGEAYAQRLQAAGVSTEYTCYEGMIHGFFGMSAALDSGKQAIAQAGEALRIALRA
jgi:acetyl esterase